MVSFGECFRRFSQIILIITNVFISLLGLAVMIIGIWANVDGKNYVITDNASQFTEVSVLIIVVGLFVMLVGIGGVVGAIFASTIFGRVILGLYGVILTILVICEIAGGIAAAAKKGDLQNALSTGVLDSLKNYNSSDTQRTWDDYQKTFHCCGVHSPKDYSYVYPISGIVPASCCKPSLNETQCENERLMKGSNSSEIFQDGCLQNVIDGFSRNLGAIAGGAIVLGLAQIFGIVMSCFVALYKRDDKKYEVV